MKINQQSFQKFLGGFFALLRIFCVFNK